MHRRRHFRLSRRGVVLRHGSRLCRQLLILRLRNRVLRQWLSILRRLRRRRRTWTEHRSRLLVDRLALLYRLILVLNRQLLQLWLLQLLQRLRLRLPVDWLRLRHRRGVILTVVVHADFGIVQEELTCGG